MIDFIILKKATKHARVRLDCTRLNLYIFKISVVDSLQFLCGSSIGDTMHYVMICPFYRIFKAHLLMHTCSTASTANLRYCNKKCTLNENIFFLAVHDYVA